MRGSQLPYGDDSGLGRARGSHDGEERGMLRVEAIGVSIDLDGKRTCGIGVRRSSDGSAVELSPSCGNAGLLGRARTDVFTKIGGQRLWRAQLAADEPDSLYQKANEQRSS
jgi:hypothetical protein